MDVIVVLPNTTSETSGALNSMGPGGTVIYFIIGKNIPKDVLHGIILLNNGGMIII